MQGLRLGLFALLLLGCVERPAPGWKVAGPDRHPLGSFGGMIALQNEAGELVLARSAKEALGDVPEFDSATAWRGGWLLTRLGTEGERGPATQNWFVEPDGDVVELEQQFEAVAATSDGLYMVRANCQFHRQTYAVTQIVFARDFESEPRVVAGPWEWLCARSIDIDARGRIWLVGSIHGITADLSDVVLIVEDGRPRVVHRLTDDISGVFQSRTQLAIVDGNLYLSAPRQPDPELPWRGIVRLVPDADHLRPERVVPSEARVRRVGKNLRLGHSLGSMGIVSADGRFDILPYHRPLDEIVDRLLAIVDPGELVRLTTFASRGCPDLEPLARLPAGVVIEFVGLVDDACAEEIERFQQQRTE